MRTGDVVAGLLKNNRSSLVELPQLLSDAALAGELPAVEAALSARLERERFIRDLFAAKTAPERLSVAIHAKRVPLRVRLRLALYAAFPEALAPFFWLKRTLAGGR